MNTNSRLRARKLSGALVLMVGQLAVGPACGGDDGASPLAPTDPATLDLTLLDLASFGEKRVGTPGGAAAGDYMSTRVPSG